MFTALSSQSVTIQLKPPAHSSATLDAVAQGSTGAQAAKRPKQQQQQQQQQRQPGQPHHLQHPQQQQRQQQQQAPQQQAVKQSARPKDASKRAAAAAAAAAASKAKPRSNTSSGADGSQPKTMFYDMLAEQGIAAPSKAAAAGGGLQAAFLQDLRMERELARKLKVKKVRDVGAQGVGGWT
jgi:outer membrane biosynthesis protein TonB